MKLVRQVLDNYIRFSSKLVDNILNNKISFDDFLSLNYPQYYFLVDNVLNSFNLVAPSPVTCGPNCSACCITIVDIAPLEAVYLWRYVRKHYSNDEIEELIVSLKKNDEKQRILKQKFPTDRQAMSKAYMELKQNCIFLDAKKNCRVHKVRPTICRNHNVVSPPSLCWDIANIQQVKIWRHPSLVKLDMTFQKKLSLYFLGTDKYKSMEELLLEFKDFQV